MRFYACLGALTAERGDARERVEPLVDEVAALYGQALDVAQAAVALDLKALGSHGHRCSASVHRLAAIELYERWGATAIAASL